MLSESDLTTRIERLTGARNVNVVQRMQSLWSGYGAIVRVEAEHGGQQVSWVVKCVEPPNKRSHPRGWQSDRSHQRKLKSYDVEAHFYRNVATVLPQRSRVPRLIAQSRDAERWLFVLEDLDAQGYPARAHRLTETQLLDCLRWLAYFHTATLHHPGDNLWKVGTYWHLATRPDELKVLNDAALKQAASRLDAALNSARFLSLVHGDAKVENFCFAGGRDAPAVVGVAPVAAVDFQYVGRGCGMKDVAYFFSSCLDEDECAALVPEYLDVYFEFLRQAVVELNIEVDCAAWETEWRALYPVAWADFMRFLLGWAPGHYKIHAYSRAMTEQALLALRA